MKNWTIKKLGEVCEFIGGSQPPKTDFSYIEKENYIRLIQIRDYKSDSHIVYIPKNKARRFCNSSDIMIGRYGPPVFQILKGLDGAYNVALMKAVPDETVISKEYAYLFLKYSKIQEFVIHLSQRAAGQTGVNKEAIEDYPISLPPLPEQQRIVAILDEAFAAIAKAKANAEQNLRNAKELFESYLAGVFEGKGEEWEEKRLGDIVDNIMTGPFGSMLHKSDYVEVGIPVVNPQNLVDGQIIPLRKTMINNDTFNRLEKYALKDGDIVIARRGEMGRCAIVKNINIGWLCGTGSFVIRVNKKKADSEFLNIFLSSAVVKKELEKLSIGATMSNLNQTILSELLIKAPPVIEQQSIVQKLDALSAETKKLEAIYQQKINDLEEMKKSILQKAFSGGLNYDSFD